jgi:hypothetical protein
MPEEVKAEEGDSKQEAAAQSGLRYLALGSKAALGLLGLEGDACCRCVDLEGAGDADTPDVDRMVDLLREEEWESVLFACGMSEEAGDVSVLVRLLWLIQAAVRDRGAKAPLIHLLTRGSQPLASDDVEARGAALPVHAGLWGFARAVRMEYPEELRISCLDFDPRDTSVAKKALMDALPGIRGSREDEVAVRSEGLRVSRLVRSAVKVRGPIRLNMPARGALTNLRPVPQAGRRAQALMPGWVQLRVRAVGLNFRDVLNVMGLYPGDPGPPGADVAGTVLELGEGVSHLRLADDIFGEAPGC